MNSKREIVTSKLSNRIIATTTATTEISAKKEEKGPLAKSRPHSLTHWRLSSTERLSSGTDIEDVGFVSVCERERETFFFCFFSAF